MAKSCHDLDIICWLNNSTIPTEVASFGGRHYYVKSQAPKDAADFCYKCKYQNTCTLSSTTLYVKHDTMPFLVWDRLNLPLDKITKEQKKAFLKKDIYGKCAFKIPSDLVDRQSSIIKFKNGSTASFTLLGVATKADRFIHIIGTKGEIEGKISNNKITLRICGSDYWVPNTQEIDLSSQIKDLAKYGGHSGGDYNIMKDVCAYLNGNKKSISITHLKDSINGHLCVYAIEKARKTNTIQKLGGKEK